MAKTTTKCELIEKWRKDNKMYQRMNILQRSKNLESILHTYPEGPQKEAIKKQIEKLKNT